MKSFVDIALHTHQEHSEMSVCMLQSYHLENFICTYILYGDFAIIYKKFSIRVMSDICHNDLLAPIRPNGGHCICSY